MIGTVISSIGVGFAAWVGFCGLATWRKQNKGTADHDLARRLLMDLYRLRDCIGHIRNPVMLGEEGGMPDNEPEDLNFLHRCYRSTARAYQSRFAPIEEVRARLNTAILESEAVWGTELKARFALIFSLQHELWICVNSYLITINPDESEERVDFYQKIMSERETVLHERPSDWNDEFRNELNAALSLVEDYLRQKLIR
ncbi:hypothetical protein [Pseudomonas sp.]|uniref:hypothetical protein n=1 Tax=Pseudomonas sp. TaxID=306 RepID=UPI002648824D|nr:hypothetical protein [Pseudomonas sp.]MDN5519164.1 hypothetical protein [Pseudomonas sp.]